MPPWMQHAACARIIIKLAEIGPDVYQLQSTLPESMQQVVRQYPPANEKQLRGILRRDEGFDTSESRAYVYAPTVDRGTPRLWPVMAFSGGPASVGLRIRVALFFELSDPVGASAAEGPQTPRAVGWRFEPPEGAVGAHCYYHAQPISSWNNRDSGRLPVAVPLNESHPGFPLMAEDSVGLLAAVLVSLYGHEWASVFLADRDIRRDIVPVAASLAGLNLLSSGDSNG